MGRFLPRFRSSIRPFWVLGLCLLVGGVLLGCGRGTFIGRQYDDLTAYYNGFYNAEQAFEEGLESVTQSDPEVDRTRYLSIFPDPQAGSGGSSFEEAIEKSAEVLREHPNSEWVDDALLLIGRSRYYQQNYAGATEKFREVISLDGEREGEARFWLARALLAADRYAEAAEALRAGLERDRDFGTWTARMRLVQGELRARQGDWAEAETALEAGMEGSLPDDVGGRAAFLLGQVRETLEQYEDAQRAYERVPDFNPPYSLEFAARLSAIEMQGIRGQPQEALRRLEALRREDDTNAMRGQIARVQARLYRAMDRPQDARDVLTEVLRGEDAPTGRIQGRLHYDLAILNRDTYEDFSQAAAHFDTAATNLSSTSGQRGSDADREARALPGAPSDAEAQSERFRSLAERAQAVARMDSLLRLGKMPRSELQSVVEKIRQKRLKERKKEAEAQRQRQQQFRGGRQPGGRQQGPGRRNQSGPSQQNAVQTQGSDAGFLFHRDPTLVQQGRRQFEQTWGDRPLVDNWRRVNAIRGGQQQAAAQEAAGPGPQQSGQQETSAQVVDLSAVPRDSASQAEMEAERAVARYELANALFRAAGRPDSAATWFRRVLDEDRNHPVARQALYGLAQAQRAQGDTTAAKETYRRIIEEHPGTPYAKRARQLLGREEAEPSADGAASRADSAYAEAYDAWRSGPPNRALHAFMGVARTYPDTETAPRALLAAGVVYRRSVQQDSSDQLQSQFEQYVDSLVQSTTDSTSTPESTSAQSSRRGAPSKDRAPVDTLTRQGTPQRAADTTAAQTSSGRSSTSSKQRPDAPEDTSRTARPDSASNARETGAPQRPALRQVDTTEQSPRERPNRAVDSTEAVSSSQQADTLASAADGAPDSAGDSTVTPQNVPDDSTETSQNVPVDSTQSQSGVEEPSDSFEVLLTYLTEQYGDTPAATRAQSLLDHLKQQESTADSTERPSERGTRSDSTQVSPRPDSVALPDSATGEAERAPSDTTTRRRPPDTTRPRPDPRRQPVRGDTSSTPTQDADSTRQRPPVRPSAPDTTSGDR